MVFAAFIRVSTSERREREREGEKPAELTVSFTLVRSRKQFVRPEEVNSAWWEPEKQFFSFPACSMWFFVFGFCLVLFVCVWLLFLAAKFENTLCSSINIQSSSPHIRYLQHGFWEWGGTALHFYLVEQECLINKVYCYSSNCGSNETATGADRMAGSIFCQEEKELPYRKLFKCSWTINHKIFLR